MRRRFTIHDDIIVAVFMSLISALASGALFLFAFKLLQSITETPLFFSILLALAAITCFLIGMGFVLVIYLSLKYIFHDY